MYTEGVLNLISTEIHGKIKNSSQKYSDLTWRGLYDYVKYFTELYNDIGYKDGEKVLDSLNNRFDQMRDDLIIWKDIED